MNEVTHIHLGRQSYTISVDAHSALKQYLSDIEVQVSDKDVVNEIELRMSELLTERGVTTDKVILPEDVDFLKQQLGQPSDFSEDSETTRGSQSDDKVSRRLYRDTDHALLAGVAAGLGSYFGLDATFVRIIFVLLTLFSGGIGILLYAILWLAVPPATTASEKLQMQGKSVNLESLKDSVLKSDLSGTAERASSSLPRAVSKLFAVGIRLLGVGFIVSGILMVFGVVALKTYMLLHHGKLFQENIFPVGAREQWLVIVILILVVVVAVFLMLIGIASFKRRWPIRGWATGVIAGLFLAALAPAFALSADVAPHIRDRYESTLHTTAVQNIQPFNSVSTMGDIDISYVSSPAYAVDFHYSGSPDLSKIKVYVANSTLHVDSRAFDNSKDCAMLCLFPRYNMTVEVFAPNIRSFDTPPKSERFYPAAPLAP